ncbi:MAG TPA: hypothetical protein VHU81_06410 [Thermoanaerobaculia bacterium]|jgi:hypothetical protein|nr:hypothetical protein [Thermoanaerobaculia bacterium]
MTEQLKPTRGDVKDKKAGQTLIVSAVAQLVTLAVLALMFWIYTTQNEVIGTLAGQLSAQQKQFDVCKDKPVGTPGCTKKVSADADKIVDKAKIPVIGVPVPGPRGEPGLDAPQASEIQAMIVTELAKTNPKLTPSQVQQIARVAASLVPKPADGKTPTTEQLKPLIAVAVAVFCGEDRCVGKPGRDGKDGQDAPAPTDEYLRALVNESLAAYCNQDNRPCQGAVGPTGPQGPAGPSGPAGSTGAAGRSVTDTDCVGEGSDSHWTVSYSDGTTDTAAGPCKISSTPQTLLKAGR